MKISKKILVLVSVCLLVQFCSKYAFAETWDMRIYKNLMNISVLVLNPLCHDSEKHEKIVFCHSKKRMLPFLKKDSFSLINSANIETDIISILQEQVTSVLGLPVVGQSEDHTSKQNEVRLTIKLSIIVVDGTTLSPPVDGNLAVYQITLVRLDQKESKIINKTLYPHIISIPEKTEDLRNNLKKSLAETLQSDVSDMVIKENWWMNDLEYPEYRELKEKYFKGEVELPQRLK